MRANYDYLLWKFVPFDFGFNVGESFAAGPILLAHRLIARIRKVVLDKLQRRTEIRILVGVSFANHAGQLGDGLLQRFLFEI